VLPVQLKVTLPTFPGVTFSLKPLSHTTRHLPKTHLQRQRRRPFEARQKEKKDFGVSSKVSDTCLWSDVQGLQQHTQAL
jgi:hypothetical protein